jgi:hypothetical protein
MPLDYSEFGVYQLWNRGGPEGWAIPAADGIMNARE